MNPICPYPDAKASIAFLTVQRCQELLNSNTENQRKLSKSNLAKLQQDMEQDRFHLNGETIIIGKSGKLLDGQNRILSALNARRGFWTFLAEGIDDELFYLIDGGKARRLSDVLHINREKNTIVLASTLVRLVEFQRSATSIGTCAPASIAEAINFLQANPKVRDSVSYCHCVTDVTSPSRVAWLHYMASQKCPQLASTFFTALGSGAMLPVTSPIYVLRARLLGDRQSVAKMPIRQITAILVKAWNAFVEQKPLKQLKWDDREPFPELIIPNDPAAKAA